PGVQIEVDNSPPAVTFVGGGEGQVAAKVSDRYSGPGAGTISMRRSDAEAWADLPTEIDRDGSGPATLTAHLPGDLGAGVYSFRVTATDLAGNSSSAQMRAAAGGAEAKGQASEPGKAGKGSSGARAGSRDGEGVGARSAGRPGRATRLVAHLVPVGGRRAGAVRARAFAAWDRRRGGSIGASGASLTVDYGTAVEVRGRLTDASRRGIEGRPVTVLVRGAAGIGGAPERRRVVTGRGGRLAVRLPAGISRRVVVSFHGGGGFAPAPRRALALRVRAAVSLAAEPTELETGESVRLHGRVELGPARVSGRGKLVAIQYLERATGRWRPALVVRTDAKGRFDTGYRFRYVTGLDRIRLRATAPAEGGWPFARGSSPPVTVTVRGR
ncbi:MAG TPA: hypothetical protein VHA76_12120, partial [Solirubrobacterales bacterium]|nr:hypothetical protein [Solirubrobacterales bacterium]